MWSGGEPGGNQHERCHKLRRSARKAHIASSAAKTDSQLLSLVSGETEMALPRATARTFNELNSVDAPGCLATDHPFEAITHKTNSQFWKGSQMQKGSRTGFFSSDIKKIGSQSKGSFEKRSVTWHKGSCLRKGSYMVHKQGTGHFMSIHALGQVPDCMQALRGDWWQNNALQHIAFFVCKDNFAQQNNIIN